MLWIACAAAFVLNAVQDGPVRVSIEAKRLNPSEPMPVRFTIENTGESAVDIEAPADWCAGLEIRDAKDKLVKEAAPAESHDKVRIEGRAFVGRTVDISPALRGKTFDEGVFRFVWRHGGAASAPLSVVVVRDYGVKIETNVGDISLEVYPESAPLNVLHFLGLVREGFYDGKIFTRVVPGFVMQGGNLRADGGSESPRRVKAEFNDRKHMFGTVAMARRPADPDSAETDFYICFKEQPSLDGNYTIIGQVIDGDAVVREIEKVRTDHNPCKGCGERVPPEITSHCGAHHSDRPEIDIVMKKVTLTERKRQP
ncbi:MAG: peptidylprolyl isomerase [Planctomycetes bacterium]|nr:peptidylprolyl isomerase [Planctomycetota bacterium]